MKFVLLPTSALDIILGMYFLSDNRVLIILHEGIISLWSGFLEPEECDADRRPVCMACHHVMLLLRSAMLMPGKTNVLAGIKGVAKGKVNLLV